MKYIAEKKIKTKKFINNIWLKFLNVLRVKNILFLR